MSNLVNHARRELQLLGEDPWVVEGIVKVVEAFAEMRHSGGSASVCIPMLNDLLQWKNLSPLTDNPDEWRSIDRLVSCGPDLWQNRRNPEAFSNNAGRTYYLVSELHPRKLYTSKSQTTKEQ